MVNANAVPRRFAPGADQRLRTGEQWGPIRTGTYGSVVQFMGENNLLEATFSINHAR